MTSTPNLHGGNLRYACEKYGGRMDEWLDFSNNINPFGLPDAELDSLWSDARQDLKNYPDPEYLELRNLLAERHELSRINIWPFNGTNDAIHALASLWRSKDASIPAPSFREYFRAAKINNCPIEEPLFWNGSGKRSQDIASLIPLNGICFVGHPNSPTGEMLDIEELMTLSDFAEKRNSLLVVDEAFLPFTSSAENNSMIHTLPQKTNLVVLRSLTKTHALPGIRLGYVVAHEKIISQLQTLVPSWNVNTLATAIGANLNKYENIIEEQIKYVVAESKWFYKELGLISKVEARPSVCNFFLCKLVDCKMTVQALQDRLANDRILIRDCSNYPGLTDQHFRLAVRQSEENDRLFHRLKEILNR